MEEMNVKTLIEVLTEKIRSLQVDVSILKFRNERLEAENEELKWHLNPLGKREENANA